MMKSMYTGISGLKNNQMKLDVISNNVANVGTTSFKKSNIRFADNLYQTNSFTTGPSDRYGGVNARQVGLGTNIAGVIKMTEQGSLQLTSRKTDFAIDGEGYFVVATGSGTTDDPYKLNYTRDGSFTLDSSGALVTLDGYYVMAKSIKSQTDFEIDPDAKLEKVFIPDKYPVPVVDANGNPVLDANGDPEVEMKTVTDFSLSGDANGVLTLVFEDGDTYSPYMVEVAVFSNPEGLSAAGGNRFTPTLNTGEIKYITELGDGPMFGRVTQGVIEMSNVDLSEEFTEMIITTRAFQSSSKVITTSDELLQEIINLKR
jgi:flagellar hook protein FlgE